MALPVLRPAPAAAFVAAALLAPSPWEVGLTYVHNFNGEILSKGPNQSLNELGVRVGYRLK